MPEARSRHIGRRAPEADTRADPVIDHAIEHGYLDSGEVFTVPGMASHDIANDGRLSVNRAARRRNLSPGAWVADADGNPCNPAKQPCADPGGPHLVKFRLWSKNTARTHIFRETGGDPSKLKYNPWTSHKRVRHDDQGNLPG
jgi:hypothetical protein